MSSARKKRRAAPRLRIGTSGWYYPHFRGVFYPENYRAADMLAFYSSRFDSAEINNSFNKLPSEETFRAWRDATPPDFFFSVKANRYLTQ